MTTLSGWCISSSPRIHRRCTWPPCTCTCGHKGRVTTADDVREMVAQTFDEGALNASVGKVVTLNQTGYPQVSGDSDVVPVLVRVPSARMETTPEETAISYRGLTKATPESAKTRGVRMATENDSASEAGSA